MDETKPPELRIAQIFLSVGNFEHRRDMLALPPDTKVEIQLSVTATAISKDDGTAGVVSLGVKTNDESDPIYRFHIEMMALVEAETPNPNMSVSHYVNKIGPTMLFPFLREAVAGITGRGRFGAVWLKPMNLAADLKLVEPAAEPATSVKREPQQPQ